MKIEIIDTYAPDTDMTFILREVYEENGDPISTEVVGFYYGKPSDESTKEFTDKGLKANFEFECPFDESGCDDFKDHYRAGYDFIMALQGELAGQHHDAEIGCLDYKVVKALAATYELQDYLANRIAQAVATGELEPDPEE